MGGSFCCYYLVNDFLSTQKICKILHPDNTNTRFIESIAVVIVERSVAVAIGYSSVAVAIGYSSVAVAIG